MIEMTRIPSAMIASAATAKMSAGVRNASVIPRQLE
jgi:hypothetical protein